MAQLDYDRYLLLKNPKAGTDMLPFVKIPVNLSDKYETWNTEFSRLDKLSKKYYGNPFYDFLILLANPQYSSEFDIEDGTTIRIPFPLGKAIGDYEAAIEVIKNQ